MQAGRFKSHSFQNLAKAAGDYVDSKSHRLLLPTLMKAGIGQSMWSTVCSGVERECEGKKEMDSGPEKLFT